MNTRRTFMALVALVAVIASIAVAGTGSAGVTPGSGRFVYSGLDQTDGLFDIYTANGDGSGVTNLTHDGAIRNDLSPSLSPDGTKVAFSRVNPGGGSMIMVAKVAGGSAIALAPSVSPSVKNVGSRWSPDGNSVVFASNRDGNFDLYAAKIGGPAVQLTKTKAPIQNLDPAVSPSGNAIVFSRTGDRAVAGDSARLYLLKLQSGLVGRLTKTGTGHGDQGPVFSPDGSKIAFYSDRAGNEDIYILNVASSTAEQVTLHQKSDTEPVWTNGGNSLAYVSTRTGSTELWATNLAGAGPIPFEKQLTFDGRPKSHPDWANVPSPVPSPAITPPTPSTASPGK